ncbi:piggyBac transposable element-derived protein 4-like, partial [Myzus persicae]|uniref:piggyBac transposable element-derived protein 4-like n=1 Tax=Myzus persicae TaxID=13164 RepID=UPI000B939889
MDDPAGPSKRLRKTTSREGMLTSEDLNHIMNWSSDEDIDSGSSWSGGNREYIDSSDDEEENPEQAEPNVVVQQNQDIPNDLMSGNNPYDFFKLCANETLFTFIVEQTNSYAEEIFLSENITDKSRITKWKILTVAEFKVFLGLLYHMGTIRTNRLQDYWKRGYLFDLPCFNSRMCRDRWMLILRCLHFAKNPAQDDAPQPSNRLYKINPLLDIFHENIDQIQYPTRVLAIDESMVLWRGRLVFRQFIHGKRHKYGIKMYVMTDSLGFVLKCIIYSGSNDTEVGGKGHVTNVVKKLLEGKLGVGHSIYMDNYYNSVELAQYLLNNNTYCTGTLRANRKNNPQEVIKKHLNKGEMIQRFTQEGTCIMKWRDRRDVLVISTEYDGTLVEEINKKGNQITKPKAILQYNKFMGGIDHSDQMLSYYSCEHKTMRWYKKLGIHILQIILVNSHNLFNRYSGSKLNLYDFRLSVIETLIKEGLETTLAPRFTPQPKTGNHYPKMVERNENKKKKVRRCQECIKTKKRSETDIYCPTCP